MTASSRKKAAKVSRLPALVRSLFWDHDSARLTWSKDRDLIIGRVLSVGTWNTVQWLRARVGDQALREWLLDRQGAGLSPRQLRFWELILNLPRYRVNAWLADPARTAWDQRHHP